MEDFDMTKKLETLGNSQGFRSRTLFIALCSLLICLGCEQPTGQESNPVNKANNDEASSVSGIMISSADDLAKIGNDEAYSLSAAYELAENLTLSGWTPVGDKEHPFTGTFDGKNKKITIQSFAESALSGSDSGEPIYLGIFAYIKGSAGVKALVKNLSIETALNHPSVSQDADYYVGALAGYADSQSELSGILVEGKLTFKNLYSKAKTATESAVTPAVFVGGIAGALYGAELKDSTVSAVVIAYGTAASAHYNYVGGVAGMFEGGAVIARCCSTGAVTGETASDTFGTNVFAGGIAGGSEYSLATNYRGKIEDCYSTGAITAKGAYYWSWSGGIAGTVCGEGGGIYRCYATGAVKSSGLTTSFPYSGGIVADNYSKAMTQDCAALNPSVVSAFEIGRVSGYNSGGATMENNHANSAMTVNGAVVSSSDDLDGTACAAKPDKDFYQTTLGWDFEEVWKFDSGDYPTLQAVNR
jgi:hypothetical protein